MDMNMSISRERTCCIKSGNGCFMDFCFYVSAIAMLEAMS